MRRPAALRVAAGLTMTGLMGGGLLAGCGQGGLGLAQQACAHVDHSIALYQRSLHATSSQAAADQRQAQSQLQAAEPLAAAANSDDGTWNGLMTTLIESDRVSEADLIVSLRSQCSAVGAAGGPPAPTTGPTVPPGE